MRVRDEQGIAIVIALFLMTAMSVLGVSLMFLSQTETFATMNYRMMSQARYGGEAAIQRASNFLFDSTQYTVPGSVADPLSNYVTTVSPVTTTDGEPVVLSATDGIDSNYPVTAVENAFAAAATGTLAADNVSVGYSAYATLLHMQTFEAIGGTQSVLLTWQITGTGSVAGSRTASVEVTAIVETPKVPANGYGAFATDNTCGALNFDGNVTIDSYDSTNMVGETEPDIDEEGGDVGTNGNLTIGGSVAVKGNLYTPRSGVGSCTDGAVTALSESGSATVTGGSPIKLPTAVVYPTPAIPNPSTLPEAHLATATGACALLGLTLGTNCTVSGNDVIIDGGGTTLSLPSVTLTGQTNIVLVAGSPASEYNFNSLNVASLSEIRAQAASPSEGVTVNIVGKDNTGTDIANPLDMSGGSYGAVSGCATCSVYDASILQFVYGGTGDITLKGNSGAAASFYAPNANAEFVGTSDLYGSILASRLNETGTGEIHYDKRLQEEFWVVGHPMMGTFTWNRY